MAFKQVRRSAGPAGPAGKDAAGLPSLSPPAPRPHSQAGLAFPAQRKADSLRRATLLGHRPGAYLPGAKVETARRIQRAWVETPDEGILRWEPSQGGLTWYFNSASGSMYFLLDSQGGTELAGLKELEGPKHARSYKGWLAEWVGKEWLTVDQAAIREEIENVVGGGRGGGPEASQAEDAVATGDTSYEPEDRIALAQYLDTLKPAEAMKYLKAEFSEVKIPPRLAELAEKVQMHIRPATARRLAPERLKALLKINQALIGGTAKNVLVLGASKDFVFPYVITGGGASAYHMVSGEIGSAESIRKTIATYSPGAAITVQLRGVAEDGAIKLFDVSVVSNVARKFQVICYDMSYSDFFALKKAELYGIPQKFSILVDQMSWLYSGDLDSDIQQFLLSVEDGGYMISDYQFGGGSEDFILSLLGMEKIRPQEEWKITSAQVGEYLGYTVANIYHKNVNLDSAFMVKSAEFFTKVHAFIKDFDPSNFDLMSPNEKERMREGIEALLDLLKGSGNEELEKSLLSVQASVVEKEKKKEEDVDEPVVVAEVLDLGEAPLLDGSTLNQKLWPGKFEPMFMAHALQMKLSVGLELQHRKDPSLRYKIVAVDVSNKRYTLQKL